MTRRGSSAHAKSRRKPRATRRAMPLRAQLDDLEVSGLIHRAQLLPEIEYLFRHALVQEAAYGSLLKQQRRALHQVIGETLERVYPERLDDLAPILAAHFAEAEDAERALRYYRRAGDRAARRYALPEAIMHYRRALELAFVANHAAELETVYLALGRALEMNGEYTGALRLYVDMEDRARQLLEPSMELAALIARATIRSAPTSAFDEYEARALSERGLTLARQLGDRAAEAKVLWNMALLAKFSGDWPQMIVFGEPAAQLARELGMRELLATILNDTYAGYTADGRMSSAREALAEANAVWRELGNLPMLADNLATLALQETLLGNYDTGLEYAEEAHAISRSVDNAWNQSYSLWAMGSIYFERGDVDKALQSLTDSITFGERAGFAVARVYGRGILALAYGYLGDFGRAIDLARESASLAVHELSGWHSISISTLAIIYEWQGRVAEARATVGQARGLVPERDPHAVAILRFAECESGIAAHAYDAVLPIAEELTEMLQGIGAGQWLGWAWYAKGVILLGLDRLDEARASLEAARAVEEAHQGRRNLWGILARLAEIEARSGNESEAGALRAQAREVLEFIVSHISQSDLRASFVARSDVDALLHS